jgi:tetratricopeptide (TPR) repeat protein
MPAEISEAEFFGPPAPPTMAEVAASWGEGVALYDSGDYTGAIVPLQIAADGLPEEPYTQYLFGLALWKIGEFDSAERALRAASDLNPDSIKTWINLARVRLDKDDAQGALAAADSALAIDAGSADAGHQRGRALAALKQNDDALEALERAHELDPENGYVANTLGYLLLQSDRAGDALPYLEAARERLPEVAYVRNNLGVAYERSGDLASAVGEYRAAVEAGDSGGKALASIARLEPLVERLAANPASPASDDAMAEVNEGSTAEETAEAAKTQASLETDPAGN